MDFSTTWKSSKKPGKQRKYRYNAPLHVKQKLMGAHLSKDLRTKYGKRTVRVKKGDTVKVLRGKFKGKSGKIERIDLKSSKIYITGIDVTKRDGTKAFCSIDPSNVIITELDLDDKKREKSIKRKQK
ncbi:MAG: 50S ribosomal protein L24 [bacterium]|nr:50S ribosomal protein L24 [bacterium]